MKNITTRIFKLSAGIIGLLLILVVFASVSQAEVLKTEIQSALSAGDTAKAVSLLDREIKVDPAFHFNYYILGRIYYNRMQYDKALTQFKTALEKKAKHFESLYYYGVCNLKTGNLKEAQKSMEDGLKKSPKELKDWFENGFGLVQLELKNYAEADRAFRRALAINPNYPEYHINLGDANFYQGIPALAIAEYEAALKADTASLEVYYHWAEACLELKDYQCAIDKLKIVLEKDSTHAPAWMRAGSIYYKAARSATTKSDQTNRYKDAIGSYKRFMELSQAQPDSSNVRAYFEIAMSYSSLNGYEDAVKYFGSVLSIPYEPRDIYFYYGKALWGMRDYEKSGELLEKHLEWLENQNLEYKSTASEEEVFKLIGDSYFFRKPRQLISALPWYTKSLEINPNQKRVLETLAIAYHTNKSYAQALEYYQKCIDLGIDSANASIYKNAGSCALNLANAGEGTEEIDIDMEVEEFPNGELIADVNPVVLPADVDYYKLGVDYLTSYAKFNSSDSNVVELIANSYLYQMQDCENGVMWFEKLLVLKPGNCDAKKALGFAYFGGLCTKNYSKALGYLRDAYSCIASSQGACTDVELTRWIANCYHLMGAAKVEAKESPSAEYKNAFDWYGKVLECVPSDAPAKKARDDLQFEF